MTTKKGIIEAKKKNKFSSKSEEIRNYEPMEDYLKREGKKLEQKNKNKKEYSMQGYNDPLRIMKSDSPEVVKMKKLQQRSYQN
jgi:hypothetical protein